MEQIDFTTLLPKLQSGEALLASLRDSVEYDPRIINADMSKRLLGLSDIYKVYIPSEMSVEIYNKLYMATMMSLQKKGSRLRVLQQNANFNSMQGSEYNGIIGGSDSFTIIGTSGIGKSSAIERAIRLISEGKIIEAEQPYMKIIPCVVVQCPFDCSAKGMLLEILRVVDERLGTRYYQSSLRSGVTIDILIGTVAQVAINHIGVLIIDEIQHVAGHRNGIYLVGLLTQLINCSGISICMVGTPESVPFFEQAMQLARRSMGLTYSSLPYEGFFRDACKSLYEYQYVQNKVPINEGILEWLYEHSAGVISVVISLIHDAQEIAIFNGRETLDVEALSEAYDKRLGILQPHLVKDVKGVSVKKPKVDKIKIEEKPVVVSDYMSFSEIIDISKESGADVVSVLKKYVSVTEVIA